MTNFSRYQRQLLLPQMNEEKQQKLNQAKVLVVGVGGLGCPVLTTLTNVGVGNLGLVDFDRVSLTNLHRQFLFSENDLGKLKTEVARVRLNQINSETNIQLFSEAITKQNVFEILSAYDLVVDCTDNFPTRYLLNDVCVLLNKPLVYAAIFQNEGQLAVLNVDSENGKTQLRDIFPEQPNPNDFQNCNEAGVMAVLTAIMGNFQANETIKLIIGSKDLLTNKLLLFNSLTYQIQSIKFKKNHSINFPKTEEQILQNEYGNTCALEQNFIETKEQLDQWLVENKAILVDVRNEDEQPRLNGIYPSILEIPLAELDIHKEKLIHNSLVFVCQSGIRSKNALRWANENFPNKNHAHVEGGVNNIL